MGTQGSLMVRALAARARWSFEDRRDEPLWQTIARINLADRLVTLEADTDLAEGLTEGTAGKRADGE